MKGRRRKVVQGFSPTKRPFGLEPWDYFALPPCRSTLHREWEKCGLLQPESGARLREERIGDSEAVRAELGDALVKIKEAATMRFGHDAEDAAHPEPEGDGDRTPALFIKQQEAVRTVPPRECDRVGFAGIEHCGLRHRLIHFFDDEKCRRNRCKRAAQNFRRSRMQTLAQHSFRNDDPLEQRLQQIEPPDQSEVAEN